MKTLLAILANPPLTSGVRTRNRVEVARRLLSCDFAVIVNLLDVPSAGTDGISVAGGSRADWLRSRGPIKRSLAGADIVLLAYGATKPSGPARVHHAEQIQWLQGQLLKSNKPVTSVDFPPRHPSRWQRFTFVRYPGDSFEEALSLSFCRVDVADWRCVAS